MEKRGKSACLPIRKNHKQLHPSTKNSGGKGGRRTLRKESIRLSKGNAGGHHTNRDELHNVGVGSDSERVTP